MQPQVTAAIIASVTTLLVTFLPLLLKYIKVKKKAQSFVSTGVAVGYYYNFVKPVFEILEVKEIELGILKTNTKEKVIEETKEFNSNQVEIVVVLPRELSQAGIKQMQDEVYQYRKGIINRKSDKRDFAVNFYINEYDKRLIIVDSANPLNAVRQYIENLSQYKKTFEENGIRTNKRNNQEYRDRQEREIKNFQDSILEFVDDEGYAANKISFKPMK